LIRDVGMIIPSKKKPQNDHEIVVHVLEENSSTIVSLFIQKNFDPTDRFGNGKG